MELGAAARLIALMSSIIIALTTNSVQGRINCGRYGHVCFGGNGKRSDPRVSSNRLTISSKLREARKDALRSIVQSSLPSRQETWSLLDALQHKVNSRQTNQDIAADFADWLKESSHSSVDNTNAPLESPAEEQVDDFIKTDDTDDKVDVDEVRDLLAALTIQHALRTQDFNSDNSDTRDQIVL